MAQGKVYGRTDGRTDGQMQATTIPLLPERPRGKNCVIKRLIHLPIPCILSLNITMKSWKTPWVWHYFVEMSDLCMRRGTYVITYLLSAIIGKPWGPFYTHGLMVIPAWICNHMAIKCRMKLLIHSKTSTPKFKWQHHWNLGIGKWFDPTLYDWCN